MSYLIRLQRQQKEEEKAAKEAQRLAEEKRVLEERERKLEAERKRRDGERRAKEEEKRLREEDRLRKEDERKRKLKEEKVREAEKERKRKDEQLAKEQEEQAKRVAEETRKAAEAVKKVEEAVKEETRRLEREAYLKQQLAEEQRRQEELRQQELLAKEELAKQEQEQAKQVAAAMAAASAVSSSPRAHVSESGATASPSQSTRTISDAGTSDTSQGLHSRSPVTSVSTSPAHVSDVVSSQPLPVQAPSTSIASNPWAAPYPPQGIPQSPLQHMFTQPMQQGLYRPPSHFGHMGDLDAFPPRMGHAAGRGGFMGAPLQNQSPFQAMPQLQQPSSPLPQQMGGLRSPGLPPIGYGQTNVPAKQLLTLMNPNGVPGNQDLTNSAGSPLHSPSTLGAIGTPIGPFGSISPIGHTRRTSTPYGPTSGDTIRPIQRPVPIGRPKDSHHHPNSGPISNSFDSLSLGLSGLSLASDLELRPRSPSLNLTGSALDLDGIPFGKESLRASNNGSDSLGHGLSNDPMHPQPVSPGIRNQRESSFFSNSIFSGRVNGHGTSLFPSVR